LQSRCGGLSGLCGRDILLGIENVDYLYINSILLITKYYIYSRKFKKVVPSFSGAFIQKCMCRDGSVEKLVLKHFQCIIKSTVIWQNVSKFPTYFFNIQQIFPFILRIYRSINDIMKTNGNGLWRSLIWNIKLQMHACSTIVY
jgi:hypothetical protein